MSPYTRWNPKIVAAAVSIFIVITLALVFASMQHEQVEAARVTTVPSDITVVMETEICRVLTKQFNGKEIYLAEPVYHNRSCQVFIK